LANGTKSEEVSRLLHRALRVKKRKKKGTAE